MKATDMILRLLRVMGREIAFEKEGVSYHFRGYLNPIREKTERPHPSEPGQADAGMFLLLCPVCWETEKLQIQDSMTAGTEKYWIESLRTVYFGEKAAYLWGMASREEVGGTAWEKEDAVWTN